ncbi:helix-turn-helix domain-containing protein [Lentibacillus saliphilus]|uniref:helix-turn-helix domain-containing protein n=1 Tax=Lentibacillus saliphilus TaxID=2737028 RepID=UPI001C2F49F1|nr:helix-turn-helix transcriptional regulator [Lentibacillus saliphilus]
MAFGEKLFKLRKQKGLSQEALAEKLNTTRQAISKWENGQGYPETDKLLMIGNIFDVSVDYLLKDGPEEQHDHAEGYYVSKEMAEGYLISQRKIAKYIPLGLSFIVLFLFLARVPYVQLKETMDMYSIMIVVIGVLGIGLLVTAGFKEEDHYKVLKRERLLFDHNYHKELIARYETLKKKYTAISVIGAISLAVGGIGFLLERKHIDPELFQTYYPIFVGAIMVGVYILTRTIMILEAYKPLVKNEEHTNSLTFKLWKNVRNRINNL